jgi:exodeoxyribonuclease V alpha subunit
MLLIISCKLLTCHLISLCLCRRPRTSLLLVGDPDQLPPVGPGRPFAAALAAGLLPCIDLRQIYRSAAGRDIVKAAHAINQGKGALITHTQQQQQQQKLGVMLLQCFACQAGM